jgi:hypothetical protein
MVVLLWIAFNPATGVRGLGDLMPINATKVADLTTSSTQIRARPGRGSELGYQLHGSPTVTFDGDRVIVPQALLWPSH